MTLDLAAIGNCTYNALLDGCGRVVWSCFPRPDGDPVFCHLLGGAAAAVHGGDFAVELDGYSRAEQRYLPNTAVVETVLRDTHGNALRMTDCAPRFVDRGRVFRPLLFVRLIEPLEGAPRLRVLLRPRFAQGADQPVVTRGSNHLRYVHATQTLRVTTDMPITYLQAGTVFHLDRPLHFLLGADEPLASPIARTAREFIERTAEYWRNWVRPLGVPLEWQDAVIRSAITLKLCTYEETGAILAAMTSSIPEAPGTARNWDYRFCWLRDAFFVVRALNSLSEVATMENYLAYIVNLSLRAEKFQRLQPVYGLGLEEDLSETTADALPGYLDHGPVRIGNAAHTHDQHDVYGNVVLAATQAFFDRRLLHPLGPAQLERMQWIAERAWALHDRPDAGMWELRTRARVHTASSLMCWAACDRMGRITRHLGDAARADFWAGRAERIRTRILRESWSERRRTFAAAFGSDDLDAGVLLMGEVGFLPKDDPRWVSTVEVIGRDLRQGQHIYRYDSADDFGVPQTAFTACTFWYVDALARIGRHEAARELFCNLLATRNAAGLLSEGVDVKTGQLWGNFPQTYSMVGIINGAMRLSQPWSAVL